VPRYLRRFFVYACAFAGAGWFGLWLYEYSGVTWDSGWTLVILAALAAAALLAALAERD
jgi:hypothetical protein